MFNKHLKKIIDIFEKSTIASIEISSFWGFRKIKLGKHNEGSVNESSRVINQPVKISAEEKTPSIDKTKDIIIKNDDNIEEDSNTVKVFSPLVGTFYLSPKPGSPPFVNEGDSVEIGQTLCIIEAMKIFNEIESEFNGKIIKILVEDGTPVEYDQPLMIIKE